MAREAGPETGSWEGWAPSPAPAHSSLSPWIGRFRPGAWSSGELARHTSRPKLCEAGAQAGRDRKEEQLMVCAGTLGGHQESGPDSRDMGFPEQPGIPVWGLT